MASDYVRYTCNKKNEPTTREECKECPEYNPCAIEGKWCFVGALVAKIEDEKACADAVMVNAERLAMPNAIDATSVNVFMVNIENRKTLRDDILKAVRKEIYKVLG